jgi:hypothetical protein
MNSILKTLILRRLASFRLKIKFRTKYRDHFFIYKEVLSLSESCLKDKKVFWDEADNFSMLSICLLAITLTKMRSIYSLCYNGFAKDAALILRVMFEDLVNFKYMYENKSLVQDFMDYDIYLRLNIGKIIEARPDIDKGKFSSRGVELQKKWDNVRHRYTYINKKGKELIFTNWSGKSLEERARLIGQSETYDYLYRFLSNTYVHLSPVSFNDYILGYNPKRGVVVETGISEELINKVLITVLALSVDLLLGPINKEYSLGLDNEIKDLEDRIRSFPEKDTKKRSNNKND